MKTKYIASQISGVGVVVKETNTTLEVFFEETDVKKVLLKKLAKVYASYEDAENSINENGKSIAQYNPTVNQRWEDMQEQSKRNQRPSSMRS